MIVKTYKNKINGNILEIHQDDSPESPREWDNLGTMICDHPHYTLGDEQITDEDEINERLKDAVIVLPLTLYDHSGISMSVGNPIDKWDSSLVGVIYVNRDRLLKEYGVKRLSKKIIETAKDVLRNEIEIYDLYIRGETYGYQEYKINRCNLDGEHKEQLDSCWGYYGDEGIEQILSENKKEEWEEMREIIA